MNKFIAIANKEASLGMNAGHGGPFGAVVVKGNKIISKAHNMVVKSKDPTEHAEIAAIRMASRKLGRFDLRDCEIYSSCFPCPMCFAAIRWAKIGKIFFGATASDAAKIGFDDKKIYGEIRKHFKTNFLEKQLDRKECLKTLLSWKKKKNKTLY
ncbi:nucleoside deaminase [Candidatus Micrarchaeota archaeon]|nr:nucleoside deaminase [Candidatus Micrarchaeota archaeon]